ncbi:hypothetical protein SLEP1_g15237 [Rubroshorea leprosula]|uniref:Transposase-associated domain-containing protein n=1 Tax=Rubroshorea leprosula TaxID=152421 RepID=A0AAV5IUI0_9ROSI|nr:hypothetical protein SLEP1_g15237 [Rubroshorea leprosula]
MYRHGDEMGYWNNEFNARVDIFLDFAFSQTDSMFCANNMIQCPCSKCWNREWHHRRKVQSHLIKNDFMDWYFIWKRHGEIIHRKRHCTQVGESSSAAAAATMNNVPSVNQFRDMLHDAMGPNFFNNENSATGVEGATQFDASFDDPYGVSTESILEEPRGDAKQFFDLLRVADTPLFEGCDDGFTVFKWVCQLMSAKTLLNMSVTNWDYVLKHSLMAFKKVDREKLLIDYYSVKKMLRRLGLGYKKYDAYVNNCLLYYGEYESQCYLQCLVCEEPRFKQYDVHSAKPMPRKSLWYLPIIPRLQRLYISRKITEHMTCHLNCYNENEKIFHPACGEAWKHFDSTHPEFASEPRNVRLGLCTDWFTPFGHSASPYSCWPIFVLVYNLPPTMCMKQEYVFLSLIIQGPQSPGKNIDVMLRPLIDDLKQLWYSRVQTYDSFRRQYFLIKAALMWTISDLPGYGMLSGWSTHGKLACPYCMENSKAFWLEHGRKTSFFDCHRQFLPPDHPFRSNKNHFIKGRSENGTMPERLSGDEMHSRIHWLPNVLFGKPPQKQEIHGFGEVHNWVNDMAIWQERIIEIICKLKQIFPPSFFDSMEYLVIHLPYETRVGGPVQFRWMYPFESQARQVYYTPYPSINHERRGWIAALKIKARSIIEAIENKDDQQEGLTPYFQDDEPPIPQQINIDDITYEPMQYSDGSSRCTEAVESTQPLQRPNPFDLQRRVQEEVPTDVVLETPALDADIQTESPSDEDTPVRRQIVVQLRENLPNAYTSWGQDEGHLRRSSSARANRAKGPRVTHTSGLIDVNVYRKKMQQANPEGRPLTFLEVYTNRRQHKGKGKDQLPIYCNDEAQEIVDIGVSTSRQEPFRPPIIGQSNRVIELEQTVESLKVDNNSLRQSQMTLMVDNENLRQQQLTLAAQIQQLY